jgi:RNA polymerase sigma-70 factor, ECF subfamily
MERSLAALNLTFPASGEALEAETWSLLERLRGGDSAALGQVYDQHHAYVRAFARKLVGDDAVAEDVVQETFIALPRAIRGFAEGSALRTFLVGIAVNHCRHFVRAAARRRAACERLAAGNEAVGAGAVSRNPTPETALQHARLAEALSHALDELSLEHRVAFVMCELQELTAAESAALLNVPEATVRTRVFNAKRKIRAWFERRGIR